MAGKRASHRTIKTIAIDKEVVEFLEKFAKDTNSNISNILEKLAKELQKKNENRKSRNSSK